MSCYVPHQYQKEARDFVLTRFGDGQPGAGLFLDPGLGKTAITLDVASRLRESGAVGRVLVIAPRRVIHNVWVNEIEKWGFGFDYAIMQGNRRSREYNLCKDATLQFINPENVEWLQKQGVPLMYDLLVVDESTKFKNWSCKRTRALRKIIKRIPRRMILTGTPVANSLADLFSQMFILDNGEALGTAISRFRNKYMYRGGFNGYKWFMQQGADAAIFDKIKHMVLRMDADDLLELPTLVENKVPVDMKPQVLMAYKHLQRELFARIDSGQELIASGAGGCYQMCRGFANGGVYTVPGDRTSSTVIHNEKTEAMSDLLEEIGGKPTIIVYQYQHDLERIRKAIPGCPAINGDTKDKEAGLLLRQWTAGGLPTLALQPQSTSHGLNLQGTCCDIIFYGLPDRPEDYIQMVRRVWRQGADGRRVIIHLIVTKRTVDMAVWGRLCDKGSTQKTMLDALKKYRETENARPNKFGRDRV